ncbi:MAG TPA: DUF3467 domain-containing protein [Patescibacteria group bacterium]|nr:DUF3467 domain-containing protein [Patescibacteria group bacterium]
MSRRIEKTSTAQPTKITVNGNTIVGSTYAQVVGVSISDNDGTLEFVYVNPQVKSEGHTVARITLPRKSIEQLAKIIPDTIEKYEEQKK